MDRQQGMGVSPKQHELSRTVSWREMFHTGSANCSPSRSSGKPYSQSMPLSSNYNGSFTKLLGPVLKSKEEEENPAVNETSEQPEQESQQSKPKSSSSPSESLEQIVNLSSLHDTNLQLALYIAMAHAGLVLAIMVVFGAGLLLKGYWEPIQWAILISMPLREVQRALVRFWEEPLQMGLLETLMATPVAMFRAVVGTAYDAHEAVLGMVRMKESPSKKIGFGKLFQWLLSFAICTLLYDLLGPVVLAITAFVGVLVYAAVTSWLPVLLDHFFSRKSTSDEKENSLTMFYGWTIRPLVDAARWSNRGLTQSSLGSLPTKVAIVLILMMIVGSLGGTILFTYKVGIEAKDAFVTLKTHVRYSNYAESLGLNKWMEENNVTQQVDSYMNQAYDTLFQQIDSFAEVNNMTEAANVGKEFLRGFAHKGKVIGAENETDTAVALPSHPFVEKLQNVKTKLRTHDFGGAYAEAEAASSLGLGLFQIGQDDFIEKVKVTLQKSSDVGKTVLLSGSSLLGRGCYLVLFLWSSLASGAAGVFNFITQSIIFFSVLYYLITSEAGGVMYQVLNMVPLSDSVRSRCATVLDDAVSSVLLATLKTAFFQATSTWLLFTWFKIHFVYVSTFLALLQAVLPLFPNWLAALPAGAQLALECRYLESVVLMVLHVYIMDYGVVKIHKEIPGHNGYLTGLSIAGGMALFTPALKGAIMGPLIMTVLLAAKNLYAEFVLGIRANLIS